MDGRLRGDNSKFAIAMEGASRINIFFCSTDKMEQFAKRLENENARRDFKKQTITKACKNR